jgi:spoIIIJ-associated protein
VEVPGRTVEEAIEEASRRFNVNRNDLKTQTLEEGSKGFLGIGSKPARVKVSLKPQAIVPFAEGILTRLLRGMGLPDTVKILKDSDGNSVLNIEGPSSGTLIGRHGNTLESLQYLVLKVVLRMTGDEKANITVDVENYLERQKDKLKELAVSLAVKAKETGVEIPMRPMSSKDRRVVHLALKEHEHVTTESRGEGLRRKVVIVPKVKAVVQPAAAAITAEEGSPASAAAPMEAPAAAPAGEAGSPDFDDRQPFTPVEIKAVPAGDREPGNTVPPEKPIDDDIGNH